MKEITVCLLEGIGNTIMTTPMIEALKQLGYKIKFLINPAGQNLIPLIGNHEYKIGKNTNELTAVPMLWARCGNKVSPKQITAKKLDPRTTHESEINMTIARQLGYTRTTPPPTLLHKVKPIKNNTITIAIGCKQGPEWDKKKYPHWEQLCKELSTKYKLSFVGTTTESKPWMNIGENKCNKTSLNESINWIAGSNGMIAIDNGLAHIAAALNIPTNVIFGPTLITKNRPIGEKVNIITKNTECSPCQLTDNWKNCKNHTCMNIPIDTILNNIKL